MTYACCPQQSQYGQYLEGYLNSGAFPWEPSPHRTISILRRWWGFFLSHVEIIRVLALCSFLSLVHWRWNLGPTYLYLLLPESMAQALHKWIKVIQALPSWSMELKGLKESYAHGESSFHISINFVSNGLLPLGRWCLLLVSGGLLMHCEFWIAELRSEREILLCHFQNH